jgi:spermidine/putrescine ABC transporter ATP-binding subunit
VGAFQGGVLTALSAHLQIRGVRRRFGPVAALDGVDLAIARGELFVLLGGSGSGKTTLLRCIGGFERPDGGAILLDGRDMIDLPPHLRPVNTMFQSYALFPHMSVAANVAFGLRGMERAARDERVGEMLDLVRLGGYGARRPHQLSGGQRQRVALARALARRPELLLLDEPLSALDRNLREATRQELAAVQQRLGITFILVTHDQEEALTMGTRIGVMQAGRLAQVGTPAEIYERPNCRYVAEFLGAANILPGVVKQTGPAGTLVEMAGFSLRAAMAAPVAPGATVHVAIRPERLRLAGGSENQVAGRVSQVAYRGEALAVVVEMPDGQMLRVSQALGEGIGQPPVIGTPITVSWAASACVLLAT